MSHRFPSGGDVGEDLDATFDALFVSGSSPRPESAVSLGSSPAGSPARSAAAVADEEADESPPCSPPRPTLSRVCSGVMDIPAAADAEEQARTPLVGPSVLPAPPAPAPAAPAPGADAAQAAEEAAEPRKLEPNDFTILSLVGQGAFGKVRAAGRAAAGALLKSAAQVFQVQERFHGGRVLAMKVMRKAHVVEKNQAEYMRTERDVLTRVEHPFIVLLHYSFQVGRLLQLARA